MADRFDIVNQKLLQFRDQNDWAFRSTMNTGLKRIEPGMDIGVGLGEEWEMAERITRGEGS